MVVEPAESLAEQIRLELRRVADPSRASGQQAYMKSAMPFLGVRVPQTRSVAVRCVRGVGDADLLRNVVEKLWADATHREERYAAMAVLGSGVLYGQWANVALIELMTSQGQWWDIIDELAHRVADLHDVEPEATAALVRGWSVRPDFWFRRLAILSQLTRGSRTDAALLAEVIEPNLGDTEFFIRKAIGWALRDFARIDPEWVRRFVEDHELSPLSRREALKHLG